MKKTIRTEKLPIKLWLDDIEEGALLQAGNLANLPFAFRHIAIMPDAHQGYGMPIGGVLATRDVIIPNAVGVDIGCGMCAVQTSLQEIDRESLKKIMTEIRMLVPLGFKHHKHRQSASLMPSAGGNLKIIEIEYRNALKQVGTLGGGNHFIELQKGSDGFIWIMVHSGSRNIGYQVANYYNKKAIDINSRSKSAIPKNWQLAYLELDSVIGQTYWNEMRYCVDFAFANRKLIIERIMEAIVDNIRSGIRFSDLINIAHNYAAGEKHFGRQVIVHRKGATRAEKGEYGIIPGSQGSKSYIVIGRGNPESFRSCSHGAGRIMGRKQAQRQLDLEKEKKRLDSLGINHAIRGKRDLDEAAGAYKDISTVMENQEDLVEIDIELTPLAVIKG